MDCLERFDLYLLPPDDMAQTLGALFTLQERIDRLVILAEGDAEEMRRLDRFAQALRKFAKNRGLGWRVARRNLDPDDSLRGTFDPHRSALLAAATEASTLLRRAAEWGESGAIYAYDAWDDRLFLHQGPHIEAVPTKPMRLNDFCEMVGYEILEKRTIENLPDRSRALEALFEKEGAFLAARKALLDLGRLNAGADEAIKKALHTLAITDKRGILLPEATSSLQGGLFEEYVYTLCLDAGFDDALLGCKIDFTPSISDVQSHVVNEFDILLIRRNRVATIECKYVHRLDGVDFVYKYDAVADYFGQTARALILNVSHRLRRPHDRGENFADSVLRRSLLGNVRIYGDIHFDRAKFFNALEWLKR